MTEGMSLSQIYRPTINMNNTEVGNNPNDKNSSEEYFDRRTPQQQQEEFNQSPFVDRSAQLRATLNSLAALNAANVVQAKKKYKAKNDPPKKIENSKVINPIEQEKEKNNDNNK